MNTIKIERIIRFNTSVNVLFSCDGAINHYFNKTKQFEVEFFESIVDVPNSIIIIPFITNILPIVWLSDASLYVDELDSDFYDCLDSIKDGYAKMCPKLSYKGQVYVNTLIKNEIHSNNASTLFSGGLDAFSTLIAHIEEKPKPITLWGADIKLSDEPGWLYVKGQTEKVSQQFNLPNPAFIKSNFRSFFNEYNLDALVHDKSGDYWWHGFQHGIGMLGLVAPIAYKHQIRTLYIASSYKEGDNEICASDPTIDNHLKFAGTSIFHDQYNYGRQEKIQLVSSFCQNYNCQINLRVCWQNSGGKNCCKCEKCIRTIMGFLAENQDPQKYGFKYDDEVVANFPKIVSTVLKDNQFLSTLWNEVQSRFIETGAYKNDTKYNWIYTFNVNPKHSILYRTRFHIIRFLRRTYHKIRY